MASHQLAIGVWLERLNDTGKASGAAVSSSPVVPCSTAQALVPGMFPAWETGGGLTEGDEAGGH